MTSSRRRRRDVRRRDRARSNARRKREGGPSREVTTRASRARARGAWESDGRAAEPVSAGMDPSEGTRVARAFPDLSGLPGARTAPRGGRRTSASAETNLARVAGGDGVRETREARVRPTSRVTHRSCRAAWLPSGSAEGRDGRTRAKECVPRRVVERFFAFSWKRRNSEDVPGSLSGGLLLLHVFATGHHTQSVLNRVSEIRKRRQAASANRRFSPVKTAGARRRGQISRRRRAAGRSRPHTDPTSTPPL